MIGGISSSVALAQRTASKARTTMDAMARQISTGQKVASVKDDGAAWARASSLKAEKSRLNVLSGWMAEASMRNGVSMSVREQELSGLEILADRFRAAMSTNAGSGARAALAQEIYGVIDDRKGLRAPSEVFDPSYGIIQMAYENDSFTAGQVVNWSRPDYLYSSFDVDALYLNVETKTQAELQASLAAVVNWQGIIAGAQAETGTHARRADATRVRAEKQIDSVNVQIGNLTDADLGQASTQRQNAEVRQQLALDTIKTALTAYGNYANGLLGNVQRTQNGVRA